MHSSDRIRGSLSSKLKGKKIVLAMTGSIACVECVKLARQLIRHGADVVAVMSKEATQFLSPESMKFATGNDVITELTGRAEHTGNEGDILLIAPCTANTISKIALGIADNAVTTFTLAFDKKIMIAPAQKGIMVQADSESLKRGLLGRSMVKGDVVVLGGVQRRRDLFSEMGLGEDFGNMFGEELEDD